MLGQAALRLHLFGFAGGQGGAGALHGQFEVGGLQAHQQVAFPDVLVVLDPHLVDACAQLAGNARDLTLYVGVVGAFVEAALEVPVAQEGEGDDGHHGEEDQQAAFELGRHEDYRSRDVNKFNSGTWPVDK
ncbi:hypothetical protein D3C75_796750 [compost metagenome]